VSSGSAAQRGFVAGRRLALVLLAAVRFRVATRFFDGVRFAVAGLDARDDTRVECRVRWRTDFLGAASAITPKANTATSASATILIVRRIIVIILQGVGYLGG
jgi:hypothetical protein